MKTILLVLEAMALRQRMELPPGWQGPLQDIINYSGEVEGADPDALARCCRLLGWPKPRRVRGLPGPEKFPLVAWRASSGWALADQWQSEQLLRVVAAAGVEEWAISGEKIIFYAIEVPGVRQSRMPSMALPIFLNAILSRKRMLVEGFIATAVLSIVALGTSMFSMQVYDRVIPQGGLSTLWVLLVGVMIAVVIDFILRLIRSVTLDNEAAAIDADISSQFFARLQAVRLDARPPSIGSLAAQMRGLEQVRATMSSASLLVLADLPFAIFLIWIVWMLGGVVAYVPLVAFPLSIALALLVANRIEEGTKGLQVGTYRKNGQLVEALDAAETIKATRGHWELLARWNQLSIDVHEQDRQVRRWVALSHAGVSAISQATYVIMVTTGALEVIAGRMTTGAVIACSIIAGRITGPMISALPSLIVQWSYARAALDGLDKILAMPVDREADGEYLRPESVAGALHLDNVRFAYPGSRAGLEVSALQVRPGERVAIIGPVGSGKSTLLKVMGGLYRPQTGSVLISGLDLNQLAEDVLRRDVGYLPQDYRLVNGTLRDNLVLGRMDPGDEELMRIAASVGLDATISGHPKGLQLPIAEGGQGLSGGQRQLAGLTRLLLGAPRLMLLDEPTAALDPECEVRVMGALSRAAGEQGTLVMVTHKISLLSHVQRVILVVGGRVVLDGPTAVVLKRLQESASVAPVKAVAAAGGVGA